MSVNAIGGYVDFPVSQITSVKTASADTTTRNTNGDSVSISSGALMANLLTDFMDGAGKDGVIILDEIRAFRDKEIALTQNILRDTLKDLNLKSVGRLQIDMDPRTNEVLVTGGTEEQNNAIATALQQNDSFRNAWNAASGSSTFLAAAEASIPFQNAYSSDPEAAVAQYNWLFNKDWDFNMYFEDGKVDYSVT